MTELKTNRLPMTRRLPSLFAKFLLEGFQPTSHLAYGDSPEPRETPVADGRELLFTSETGYQLFVVRQSGETVNYVVVDPDGTEQDGVVIAQGAAPIEADNSEVLDYEMHVHVCWYDERSQCSHCKEV